jgi:hypothetical protein
VRREYPFTAAGAPTIILGVKLLWFGTSNDGGGYLTEAHRAPHGVSRALSVALEMPVETTVRTIWPDERLPGLVEHWLADMEPDLVFIKLASYWTCYESVPLKIRRRFGWAGRPVVEAGRKVAGVGWVASSRAAQVGRELALRTIGGEAHFEPEEVVERVTTCIRTVLQNENSALVVNGPRHVNSFGRSEKARRRAEPRRRYVHRALRDLCGELHVVYLGVKNPQFETRTLATFGDRVHFDEAHQQSEVERLVPALLTAWRQQHPAGPDSSRAAVAGGRRA